jgi:paraquat-inducible protein B
MTPQASDPAPLSEAIVTTRRRPSIVWLIPVVAVAVGAFVAWKTWADLGPLVTIDFVTAEGLEAGKTKLKYKDVEVGVVEEIVLQKDLSGVVCTARMVKGAEEYLTEQTRFWVVKPRIAGGQVSGLGTLFSGAYVGIDPAREGKRARHFTGLEIPPIITMDQPGKHFVLRSHKAGSVDVGTPIYFRKIRVGEVVASELDESGEFVTVRVFVHAPHDQRVREDTKFWNASGVHFSLSAAGVEVDIESLVSLLVGGIAFDTPLLESTAAPAVDGASYLLYASRDATEREIYTQQTHYLLYFDQSVRGLAPGAPVEFRGIQLGEVQDVKLEYDPKTQNFRVPVLIAIEPQRIANLGGLDRESRREGMQRLVSQEGLRAQLQSGNLLTGQLIVQLDTHEGVPPAEIVWSEPYAVFPTIATPLEEITSSVTRLVKKLEKMPIDQLAASVNATLDTARAALEQAERTLAAASGLVGPDSPVNQELRQALVGLTEAARSIGLAADQIERQPDSLIFGKGGKQ